MIEPLDNQGGSSPRVWGTQAYRHLGMFPLRFIPTGVGNASRHNQKTIGHAVHPHGCRERCSSTMLERQKTGSSPRVWGTPYRLRLYRLQGRFIPTGVGNAWDGGIKNKSVPVHPHGCGERRCLGCKLKQEIGSSPRVWGTLSKMEKRKSFLRFIPTGVGNAFQSSEPGIKWTVHPHGCGERQPQQHSAV